MSGLFDLALENIIGVLQLFLPACSGIPSNVATGFTTFINYLKGLDLLLPISDLFTILGLMLAYELAVFTFHFFRMIMNWVRGSGA